MVSFFYRISLSVSSTFLMVVIFLIKERYIFIPLEHFSRYYSWLAYFVLYALISFTPYILCMYLPKSKYYNDSSSEKSRFKELKIASYNFLPSYLGYFFVSLSVYELDVFIFVYIIVLVFTFLSDSLYFNPFFLILGYSFYFVKTNMDVEALLITKKKLKLPNDYGTRAVRIINDRTWIDINCKNEKN